MSARPTSNSRPYGSFSRGSTGRWRPEHRPGFEVGDMGSKKKTGSRRESRPAAAPSGRGIPLRSMTEQALDSYFTSLNGHAPGRLYDLVMREVEEPLFRAVLDYA